MGSLEKQSNLINETIKIKHKNNNVNSGRLFEYLSIKINEFITKILRYKNFK